MYRGESFLNIFKGLFGMGMGKNLLSEMGFKTLRNIVDVSQKKMIEKANSKIPNTNHNYKM